VLLLFIFLNTFFNSFFLHFFLKKNLSFIFTPRNVKTVVEQPPADNCYVVCMTTTTTTWHNVWIGVGKAPLVSFMPTWQGQLSRDQFNFIDGGLTSTVNIWASPFKPDKTVSYNTEMCGR
jgi:hypothetical protein